MNHTPRTVASAGVSLAALLAFVAVASSMVFSRGVCCADDANNAVAAKNLATGLGYATTMTQEPGRFAFNAFDARVTTGPTLLLPAAAGIWMVGNTHWAPGLSVVLVWSVVLVVIGIVVRADFTGAAMASATVVFLFLNYSLMTYHFEQWFALLGEIPSALLFLLGVLLVLRASSQSLRFRAGVVLGLAVLAKMSAGIGIAAFAFGMALTHLIGRPMWPPLHPRDVGRAVLAVAAGLALPIVAFEVWKVIVLGWDGYASHLGESVQYIKGQAGSSRNATGLLGLYETSAGALWDRFRIYLPTMTLGFAVVWTMIRKDARLTRLFLILTVVIAVHTAWWVGLSIGWPRYFVFALPLAAFIFAMPFLSPTTSRTRRVAYVLLLGLGTAPGWNRLSIPFERHASSGPFVASAGTQHLLSVAELLTPAAAGREVIVTQSWATGIDVEYTLDTHSNLTHEADDAAIGTRPYWVVLNRRFMRSNDPVLAARLEPCFERKVYEPYVVARCAATAGSKP